MVSATIDVKNEKKKGDKDEKREILGTEKVTLEGKECSALAPKVMNEGEPQNKITGTESSARFQGLA